MISAIIFVATTLAIGYLVLDASMDIRKQEQKKAQLQADIEVAKYIEDLKEIYLASQASVQLMSETDALTYNEPEQLNDLITALERALPKRSVVKSMNISGDTMTMGFETVTKEEAAKVLMQLKTIPYIKSVTVGGITGSAGGDETNRTKVQFTVNCELQRYEPVVENPTEGQEE